MITITLEGKTKKGRERVARDGSKGWILRDRQMQISFTDKRGPWLLLQQGDNVGSLRWVHLTDDPHFAVTTED